MDLNVYIKNQPKQNIFNLEKILNLMRGANEISNLLLSGRN